MRRKMLQLLDTVMTRSGTPDKSPSITLSDVLNAAVNDTRLADTDLSWDPPLPDFYDREASWAQPDVDQAADWMRLLVDDADFRARMGRRGQQLIRSRYSKAHAGQAMARRLAAIAAMNPT